LRSNRRAEPRRRSGPHTQVVPVRGRRPVCAGNREEYRGARSGPPGPPAHGARTVHGPEGRPSSGSGNLLKTAASGHNTTGPHVGLRGQSLHTSGVKGHGSPAAGAGGGAAPALRALRMARPAGAFSSVGESARLITVRSLVRIQKGPRPRLGADADGSRRSRSPGPRPARGCSSAGRAPALQAGGRRFEPAHLQGETLAAQCRVTPAPSHQE
jgi:hypothetical protein